MNRFNTSALAAPPPPASAAVAVAPAPKPAAPAPSGGLKKIAFAKPAKKEETKTAYPVFSNPQNPHIAEQVLAIAKRVKERDAELKSLEGAQKTDKAELGMFVLPFYFEVNRGRSEPPSSISIPSAAGEVLVTFQNRYTKIEDERPLIPLLGADVEKYFKQAFTLKIKGETLPQDRAQDIVNEIQEVLARHNAMDALDVSEEIKPIATFHDQRHTLFTPEQNVALNEVAPIVMMVKTQGRGSK
jgi:hypothetical protein